MKPLPESGFRGRVLVIGDVMLDRTLTGAGERLSPEAPVPVVTILHESERLGGAANVAAGAHALGATVALIGVIGDDSAGRQIAELVAAAGIEPSGLVMIPGRPTTTKSRVVAGKQQLVRVDHEHTTSLDPAVFSDLVESEIDARPDVVVLSDYAKGVLSDALLERVVGACRRRSIGVVVDPKSRDFGRYRGARVVTPNLSELIAASSIPIDANDLAAVSAHAQQLALRNGIETIVVTLGERGMVVCPAEGPCRTIAAVAREVFDVTGAGDTVTATLAAALAHGLDVFDSAEVANVAGGLAVGRTGTAVVNFDDLSNVLGAVVRKPLGWGDLLAKIEAWRAAGKTIVFTNGCFDLLHAGHVELLRGARDQGDVLVVGLNSDESVRRLKGPGRPLMSDAARAAVLSELRSVDAITLFDADTPDELVQLLQPDVIVKGGDYAPSDVVGGDIVRARGGRVVIVPLVGDHSTTSIVERMRRG